MHMIGCETVISRKIYSFCVVVDIVWIRFYFSMTLHCNGSIFSRKFHAMIHADWCRPLPQKEVNHMTSTTQEKFRFLFIIHCAFEKREAKEVKPMWLMIMMNLNLDYDDDFAESERKWNALCARKVIRWKSRECATITRRMMNERIRLFCKSRHQVTGTQTSLLKRKIRCNRMKSGRFEAFDELMMSFIDCDRYTKTFKNSKMRHEESREEKKRI